MKKLLLVITVIFALTGTLIAQDGPTRKGIPWVTPGCDIVLVNDEPNIQTITVSFHEAVLNYTLRPYEVKKFVSPERGYALVQSDKTDFTAYSIVAGAVFNSQRLNTFDRGFLATPQTGLAISNPWQTPIKISLVSENVNGKELYFTREIGSGETFDGFIGDMLIVPSDSVWITVLSEMPVFLGIADCDSQTCRNMQVKSYGVVEIGVF